MRMTIPRSGDLMIGDVDALPEADRTVLKDVLRSPTVCDIETAQLEENDITVVLCSELPIGKNPGQSITNAAEAIATHVCRRFSIPHDKLLWIEHYPVAAFYTSEPHNNQPTFDMVTFTSTGGILQHPQWRPMTDAEKTLFLPLFGRQV